MFCSIFKEMCVGNSGASPAQRQASAWIQRGGPFLQNHTFVSWARSHGTSSLDIFWKNVMIEKWTKQIENIILKHFRCVWPFTQSPDKDECLLSGSSSRW